MLKGSGNRMNVIEVALWKSSCNRIKIISKMRTNFPLFFPQGSHSLEFAPLCSLEFSRLGVIKS